MSTMMTDEEREAWLAIRKEAAHQIDPETAEVTWWYVQIMDPYGVDPDLPEEYQCAGRGYFARAPGSDMGRVWRFARSDPSRTLEEAQVKVGVSGGS